MEILVPQCENLARLLDENLPYEIKNFSRDKVYYILHLLFELPARNKKLKISGGFVPLYSTLLQKAFRDYKQYLKYLIRIGVLESDNHFIKGKKSKGYRLVCQTPVIRIEVLTQKKIAKRLCKKAISPGLNRKYPHLVKWFNEGLQIQRELATSYIEEDLNRKRLDPSLCDKNVNDGTSKDPFIQYACASMNIQKIASQQYNLSVDSSVFRFHSNLSNMNSTLRNFLTYENQTLASNDIKNCQPFLSIALLKSDFWSTQSQNTSISIFNYYNIIYNILQSHHKCSSYIMLVNDAVMQAGSDLYEYIQLVSNGAFYEYFGEKLKDKLGMSYSNRKEIKTAVFQMLFTDNRFLGQKEAAPKMVFKETFPSVYQIFSAMKKYNKTLLPRLLQRIESDLVIERMAKKIAKERPEVPIFTIHDSIATTIECNDFVSEIMNEVLMDTIGYSTKISQDVWHPSKAIYQF